MFRFEQLTIWKNSIDFANQIYRVTKKFPKEAFFELTGQLRNASISVSSNIAEGSGSESRKDFCLFLNIAMRSLFESVSQLKIAQMRGYISQEEFNILYQQSVVLAKQISTLKKRLK
jgi:four helix bundle protein